MKLSELTITEGRVEPNALYSVRNVMMRGGKSPNTFELIVMARYLTLLQGGGFCSDANVVWNSNVTTCPVLLNALRELPADELTQIAAKLYQAMTAFDQGSVMDCFTGSPGVDPLYWIKLATAREAND